MLRLVEKLIDNLYSVLPRQIPDKRQLKNTRIIAHRGAHDHAKGIYENTLAAFDRAKALGCDGIELDIHATRDHQLVVHHDPDLSRLWGLPYRIADMSFQALRQKAPNVPLLSEVIKIYGKKMHLFIELKAPFSEEQALSSVLKPLEAGADYHLISLDEAIFAGMNLFERQHMLLVADFNKTKTYCQLSLQKHYGGVMGHYLLLNQRIVHALKSAHQNVGVGFVDSTNSLYREVNRGIPWLFTNNPSALFESKAVNNQSF